CYTTQSLLLIIRSYILTLVSCYYIFFFFQAEDGIRDATVTGVQTCALPISSLGWRFSLETALTKPDAHLSAAFGLSEAIYAFASKARSTAKGDQTSFISWNGEAMLL